MPETSILDERLAEIDRRLSTIQTGLRPATPPAPEIDSPVRLRAAPEPDASSEVTPAVAGESVRAPGRAAEVDDLRELAAAHERLLELHRDLLTQYADLLERRAGDLGGASLDAGPFSSAAAVRAFEHALRGLPGVRAVAVREYRGEDRVVLDVALDAG